jgi:5-methylthioadenosine/S-adenosylhomocysteine deaminase
VIPVEGEVIAGGAVLVGQDGRILAVGPDQSVPSPPGTISERLADAAVLPGLVNTHTHLELTGLQGQITEGDFPSWIRGIITRKAERTPADFLAAARQGLADCWATGVTTVADTGDSGAVVQVLAELGGSGIAYHEVFGPHPEQAAGSLRAAAARLVELERFTGPRVRLGISPHAPYSVSGPLYALVAAFAVEHQLPVAVHLAESEDESLLLEQASGGFARALQERGIPLPALPGRSPVAWLDQHHVLTPRTLCIHVVRADATDLDTLARRGAAVAHCPRSNRRHAGRAAPLAQLLGRGIRVGIGTDSVASVSPLDPLAEAREARGLGALGAERTVKLLTLDGARALGLENEIGSLAPGKWGDLAAFDLPGAVDGSRLADTLLSLPRAAVRRTVLGGREVYQRRDHAIGRLAASADSLSRSPTSS